MSIQTITCEYCSKAVTKRCLKNHQGSKGCLQKQGKSADVGKIECDVCHEMITKRCIYAHKKSKKCRNATPPTSPCSVPTSEGSFETDDDECIVYTPAPKVEETSVVVHQAPVVEEKKDYQRCPFACNDTRKHILSFLYGDEGPVMLPPPKVVAKCIGDRIQYDTTLPYREMTDEGMLAIADKVHRYYFWSITEQICNRKSYFEDEALEILQDLHKVFIFTLVNGNDISVCEMTTDDRFITVTYGGVMPETYHFRSGYFDDSPETTIPDFTIATWIKCFKYWREYQLFHKL